MTDRTLLTLLAAGAMLGAIAAPAYADVAASKALVDAAKAQGTVGEQADGFLGFVKGSGDGPLAAAVAEINAGRAGVYAKAASENGAPAAAAGASAFTNVTFPRLAPGQYYRTADGAWKRK
jgi:uncharacterized protein YdbL (DUF1318 family)